MARSARLPQRLPAGTRYVVEGRTSAKGLFQVSARYVVLPSGRRFDLPSRIPATRTRTNRRPHRLAREEHAHRFGV